ncbi:zinc-binding dehydrogenase [Bacillus sp. OK048]|uniref:zinc-binding dehydrogenase n=1 Tax=Bacillus sp. OK048 TaxID=1882761 RepID=UPI00088CD108|nr:zinc-binding dehydrogenase [Bacillus sp. OK048]SDL95587.1 D-arabinose 1-dehydrogenase, Zn-dependent alcohol dehydrogenase family [Bacillus sp. OK048]
MKGKVAVMVGPQKIEYQEYGLPNLEKGALLLKIIRANVCGSDLHIWHGAHPVVKGGPMGHEMVGKIEEIGEGVTTDHSGKPIRVGDRVAVTFFQACRRCNACANGEFVLCENTLENLNRQPEEFPHFHAAYSSHYYVNPYQFFYKVPDNIPDSVAASANCAISQVLYGIDKAQLKVNETILIQGAGGLGLYGAAIAKESGAKVIIIDGVEARLNQAKKFGADHLINIREYDTVEKRNALIMEITNDKGADVGLEVSGVPDAFSEGIHHIRQGGRYVSMGNIVIGAFTQFDPGLMTRKSITINSVIRYQPSFLYKALEFLSRNINKYPFIDLVDADFKFEDIETALNKSLKREITRASIVID